MNQKNKTIQIFDVINEEIEKYRLNKKFEAEAHARANELARKRGIR